MIIGRAVGDVDTSVKAHLGNVSERILRYQTALMVKSVQYDLMDGGMYTHYYPTHESFENECRTICGTSCSKRDRFRSVWDCVCTPKSAPFTHVDVDECAEEIAAARTDPSRWKRLLEMEKQSARHGGVVVRDIIGANRNAHIGISGRVGTLQHEDTDEASFDSEDPDSGYWTSDSESDALAPGSLATVGVCQLASLEKPTVVGCLPSSLDTPPAGANAAKEATISPDAESSVTELGISMRILDLASK